MKKMILVLLLLGVMTTEGKPKYRIETWVYDGTTYYLPQRKEYVRTSHFTLPIKMWVSYRQPFQQQSIAENVIDMWKTEEKNRVEYLKSKGYITE